MKFKYSYLQLEILDNELSYLDDVFRISGGIVNNYEVEFKQSDLELLEILVNELCHLDDVSYILRMIVNNYRTDTTRVINKLLFHVRSRNNDRKYPHLCGVTGTRRMQRSKGSLWFRL